MTFEREKIVDVFLNNEEREICNGACKIINSTISTMDDLEYKSCLRISDGNLCDIGDLEDVEFLLSEISKVCGQPNQLIEA